MVTRLVGASVWEEELYDHLATHELRERAMLEEYEQVAEKSQSGALRYLVSLIVEDEVRHHRLFRQLADSLRTDAELRPEEPAIPRLDRWGHHVDDVLDATHRLLELERSDAKELRSLARQLKDLKDTTIWELLVRLMEMDTAKHMEILEFVERHAKRSR